MPAVIGPGAMLAAACRTEKRHYAVSNNVVPKSADGSPDPDSGTPLMWREHL